MLPTRNYSIDSLKMFCAILVVLIHSQFLFKDIVFPLLRIAVPIFFMISGYFIYDENNAGQKINRSIKSIFSIFIWSNLLFLLFKEVFSIAHHAIYVPDTNELLKFIVFNEDPFGWHLWYIGAYLYLLVIVRFINKHNKWTLLFKSIPVLLIVHLALSYAGVDRIYYRNFLLMGLPFFSIGAYIRKTNIQPASTNKSFFCILLFAIASIAEKQLTSLNTEIYVSTIFLSILIFKCFVNWKQTKPSIVSWGGKEYSLDIYIFHGLFVLYFFPTLNGHSGIQWNRIYNSLSPVFILGATLIFAVIYKKMKQLMFQSYINY